ncbi:hypothetical protein BASA50_007119 [Batrachochytrium salamandrivorans]|uniref:Velvet domain-containing protein n=1 Tax=Batrachochytrium salamandrivorans TaxID=1357716 RepID=A0ABQ8FB42_9FUNG|nr:hypothetical protein BASA50_007119 [Batrachochytrium salamandrivorans]
MEQCRTPIEPCIAVQLHRKAQLDILGSSHNTIQNTSLLVARAYLTSSDGCSDRSYFVKSLKAEVQKQVILDYPLSKPEVMEQHYLSLQQQQASSSSSSLVEQHIPHNQHSVPLSHKYKYPSSIDTLASLDFKTSHHPHLLSHEAPNSTDPADADHYPDSKRSVWTDITQHVLQSPLPSVPTASLFGSQTTAADIATGKDGSRGVFFFFSDIGIRVSGQFKLRIVISRMPQE